MTDNAATISKPKVRFCQLSGDARDKKEIVENCEQRTRVSPGSKEMIKRPGIVDSTKTTNIQEVSKNNCPIKFSDKRLNKQSKIIHRNQNVEKGMKTSQSDKSTGRQKGKENHIPLTSNKSSRENVSGTKKGNSRRAQSVTRERFNSLGDNRAEKANVRLGFRGPKITRSKSSPCIIKRKTNSITQEEIFDTKRSTNPFRNRPRCQIIAANKTSPVKKMILHNVTGPKINVSVRSGIFHKNQNDMKMNDTIKRNVMTDATEDLTQPQYNTIMCTINRLKELKQQNISINDISQLPATLKNFLNGKISAALDFPLDEAIYKNLVDLNVDERQLPSIFTRSKDPEPRQKDIVPKLSDFFIPKDSGDMCEAVCIKSRISKIDDHWNAFKISNKILEWKHSIDGIEFN